MASQDAHPWGAPATTVTVADVRRHNVTLVAQALYRHDLATRADLGRLTGLTRPTVRAAVAQLQRDDMLVRGAAGTASAVGRPAEQLRFNRLVATVAGIRHRGDRLETDLADLDGTVVASSNVAAPTASDALGPTVSAELERLRSTVPRAGPVRAVTVLEPGVIRRRDEGATVTHPRRAWVDVPLERLLGAALPEVAVTLLEPGAAALLGEPGLTPGVDAVFVFVDLGLVVSARVNGTIVRGAHGAAGEIGHLIVAPDGRACSCGRSGCLETVASGRAILERLGELRDPVDLSAVRTVAEMYRLQRPDVDHVVGEVAQHLGRAVGAVVSLYDPEVVVLGGTEFLAGADAFLDAVRAASERVRSRLVDIPVTYRLATPDADLRGAVQNARRALPRQLRDIVFGN